MEPFAVGFMVLIAGASVIGVVVGAIGGAVLWRLRIGVVPGAVLTAGAYLLVLVLEHHEDFIFLRAKLTWGAPSMSLAFLICSVSARWLEARTKLRPTWIALAALGFSLAMGFLYLLLFRLSMRAPLVAALAGDICLILLLMRSRRLVLQGSLTKP
jgi:hypothetical protein